MNAKTHIVYGNMTPEEEYRLNGTLCDATIRDILDQLDEVSDVDVEDLQIKVSESETEIEDLSEEIVDLKDTVEDLKNAVDTAKTAIEESIDALQTTDFLGEPIQELNRLLKASRSPGTKQALSDIIDQLGMIQTEINQKSETAKYDLEKALEEIKNTI